MPTFETVTQKLPIGYTDKNGNLYDMAEVREVLMKDNYVLRTPEAQNNPSKGITNFLAQVLVKLYNEENPSQNIPTITKDLVRDMYIADRDMLVLASKRATNGPEYKVIYNCSGCGTRVEGTDSIDSIETVYRNQLEDLVDDMSYAVDLEKGIVWDQNKPPVKRLLMSYMHGSDSEKLVAVSRSDPAKAAQQSLFMQIREFVDLPKDRANPILIDWLSLVDVNAIEHAITKHRLGPALMTEGTCYSCGFVTTLPLELITLFRMG